jgi:TetR/AcrR family transcriptional regulator, transcriptional repressor for nem operon
MSDSREQIVHVATRLFLQKGYRDVTMSDLVKESGLSKGAFYHYFESKEMLFKEVLNFFFGTIMTHDYESYSRDSLYKFYHDYIEYVLNKSMYYLNMLRGNESVEDVTMNYLLLSFDALKLFPEFRELNMKEMDREQGIWENIISIARKNGEIKTSLSDEYVARIFICINDGIAVEMIVKGTRIEAAIKDYMNVMDKFYEVIKA